MLSSSVRLSGSGPRVAPAATTAAAPIPAPLDYDDIIKLFTHRHTASLFKRQAASFRQITRERKGGLAIADLLPVCSVVALGIERIAELRSAGVPSEVFVRPLASLVRLFGLPFAKQKAYEEFDNIPSLNAMMEMLVNALGSDEPDLIHAASQTVMSLTSSRSSREFALRCELLVSSGLVGSLVLCLHRNGGDLSTALPLVSSCRHLASLGSSVASQFDGGVFGVLVALIETRDFREPLVSEIVQLLWLLLEQRDEEEEDGSANKTRRTALLASKGSSTSAVSESGSRAAVLAFASLRSVGAVAHLLRQSLAQGHRSIDKQSRNDLVVLLLLVARVPESRKLLDETGILGDLLAHATHAEMRVLADADAGALANSISATTIGANNTPTVGLQKIRALRATGSAAQLAASADNANFALTQDIATCEEDFQLKLLIWSLIGACADDAACHARLLSSSSSSSSPSGATNDGKGECDIVRVALLYLDAAEAFNLRTASAARAAEARRAAQNQALTGGTVAGGFAALATASVPALSPRQSAANTATSRLALSQLLHLQEEALRLLARVVPRAFESFVASHGVSRLLAFGVAVVANPVACEEKRLASRTSLALQARALQVLVRVLDAGTKLAAPCPIAIGTSAVDAAAFGRTTTNAGETRGGAATTTATAGGASNDQLRDLLSTDGDEALAAVRAAMAPAGVALNSLPSATSFASSSARSLGATSSAAAAALTPDAADADSSQVLSVLLGVFGDACRAAEVRCDAISAVALLVAGRPALQRQLRHLRGVHMLVQFLCDDGARATTGLDAASGVGPGAVVAAAPSAQANLAAHAAKCPALLLGAVDALWRGVIGARASESLFLALNGVDLLLDLLLVAPGPVRRPALGLLADLLVDPQAQRFLFEWRAGPGRELPGGGAAHSSASFSSSSIMGALSAGLGHISASSSTASLPTAAAWAAHAQEGFNALDLLLALWPEPSLAERHEADAAARLAPEEGDEEEEAAEEEFDSEFGGATPDEADKPRLSATARAASEARLASLPRLAGNDALRPALYGVLARLGAFREDSPFFLAASPVQRAQLFDAAAYVDARRSAALSEVTARLEAEGVVLVPEDAAFLASNTQVAAVASERAVLFARDQWAAQLAQDREEVQRYLHGITSRKAQSEAFLLTSARRARKQTMRRRLLYKEMRQQMLRDSADQSRPGQARRDARPSQAPGAASRGQSAQSKADAAAVAEEKTHWEEGDSEEQQRDDDEDVELEHRLLSELDSAPVAPLSPSARDSIPLATSADDLPDDDDSFDDAVSYEHHRRASSGASVSKKKAPLVSALDPLAEEALLVARRHQKERQAAISAALQQAQAPTRTTARTNVTAGTSRGNSARRSDVDSARPSHRTTASNASQLGKPKK